MDLPVPTTAADLARHLRHAHGLRVRRAQSDRTTLDAMHAAEHGPDGGANHTHSAVPKEG